LPLVSEASPTAAATATGKNGCPFKSALDRWSVKTTMPPAALSGPAQPVDLASLMKPTNNPPLTADDKAELDSARYIGDLNLQDPSGKPVTVHEGDKVSFQGYMRNIGCDTDGDYHVDIGLADPTQGCMIIEVPDPSVIQDPDLHQRVLAARKAIEAYQLPGHGGKPAQVKVTVEGELFLDAHHYSASRPGGGRGSAMCATTIWELHPVTLMPAP